MFKQSFIVCFLWFSATSYGQIERQLNSILLKRDFQLFINYTKGNISENNRIQIEQEYAREIVEGYQEALFKITQTYGTIGNIVYSTNAKLKIITKNNRIIFFNLEGKEIRNFPEKKGNN